MRYRVFIRGPEIGFRDNWLWLPKNKISEKTIKNSLEYDYVASNKIKTLTLWKEEPNHILVPREFVDSNTLDYKVMDLTPEFPKVEINSSIELDCLWPDKTIQQDAFDAIVDKPGGLLCLSCGRGKTIVFLHAAAHWGEPLLVINDREHILLQWKKAIEKFLKLDGEIGWIQGKPEKWNWKQPITLAMLKSLANYHDQLPLGMTDWFGRIVWDECFVSGTLVGNTPIEKIKVGDSVMSYDETSHRMTPNRVTQLFKSRPTRLVRVTINGIVVVCTLTHPFRTNLGWKFAFDLQSCDLVLCFSHEQKHLRVREGSKRKRNRKVLRRVQKEKKGVKKEKNKNVVRELRGKCCGVRKATFSVIQKLQKSLLLRRLQTRLGIEVPVRKNERDKSKALENNIKTNAREKSDVESSCKRKAKDSCASKRVDNLPWRKWKASTSSSSTSGEPAWLGYGSCRIYRNTLGRITNTLQNRHSKQRAKDSYRSGRRFTQLLESKRSRRKERQIFDWKRVESVEILEQTSDGTFGGCCPDGFVYNIEVENTHTYSVDGGIIVHNCHHLSAPSFARTAHIFPGKRFGATATPERPDGTEILYHGHVGPILHKNLSQDIIPKVVFRRSHVEIDLTNKEVARECNTCTGEIHFRKTASYVGTLEKELNLCSDVIQKGVDAGRRILALSLSRAQTIALHERFPDSGIVISGNPKKAEDRLRVIDENMLVFATADLAREALDEARLDSLVLLNEFSDENLLQQAVGRIQRKLLKGCKEPPKVVVMFHVRVPSMRAMGANLKKHFRRWGFEVETIG